MVKIIFCFWTEKTFKLTLGCGHIAAKKPRSTMHAYIIIIIKTFSISIYVESIKTNERTQMYRPVMWPGFFGGGRVIFRNLKLGGIDK